MNATDRPGSSASYSPDLVVALEHSREVVRVLEELGVPHEEVQRSPALGLALVPLPADGAVAAPLSARTDHLLTDHRARSGGAEPSDLDRLLLALRAHFAEQYAGWVPTLGKNRLLGEVIGGGKISHGGALAPVPSDEQPPARESRAGRGVRVGVLDTAIDAHPWLAGGWVAEAGDVLPASETRHAVAGHATFIAGLVLREAPGCVVAARRVLGDDGAADSWSVAQEIVEHGRAGLDVLNLSLFCHTEDGEAPLLLARAVDRLPAETVVVAAAGNHGDGGGLLADPRRPAWPAALDGVVAVGAVDGAGEDAPFSPVGVPWVDVLAAGVDCVSTYLSGDVTFDDGSTHHFGGLARWSGTSFAAASVSGAIAARTVPGEVSARRAWERLCEGDERPFVLSATARRAPSR